MSLFAEYSFYSFNSPDLHLIADGTDYKGAIHQQGRHIHAIKVGANWRLP